MKKNQLSIRFSCGFLLLLKELMPMLTTEPVRCLIIDDEPIARRIIRNHLEKVDGFTVAAECSNALEAFHLLQADNHQLLFLDIRMPRLSGLDLLRSLQHKPKVIIVSAYREYAVEGFELDVVDYLLKPVPFERFLKALDKFRQYHQAVQPIHKEETPAQEYIFIRAGRKTIRLEPDQVLFIESMSDYLKVHTREQTYLTKEKISVIEQKLPARFLRIHRSFIINTHHLQAYIPETAEVAGHELPISRSMRQGVLEVLQGK